MTKLFIPIFFVLFQINLVAQVEFAPPGAEWCYSIYGGFNPTTAYFHLAYTSDTLIQGKPGKILEGETVYGFPNNCCDTVMSKIYVYQSTDSIFSYRPYFDDFEFLFRNELSLGESVEFPALFGGALTVESVDSIPINSSLIKAFKFPYPAMEETYLFDKAGPNRGFFDDWAAVAWDGFGYRLHWYKDDEIPEFYLLSQPCGFFTSVSEPIAENSIMVFPNPVSDVLKLDIPSEKLICRIYDVSGRQVFYNNNLTENKIEVSELAPGMYFLLIEINGVFYRSKFVKN